MIDWFTVVTDRDDNSGLALLFASDLPITSNRVCSGMRLVIVVPSPISLRTSNRNERPNSLCKRRRNNTSGVSLRAFGEEKPFDFRRRHTLPIIGHVHL